MNEIRLAGKRILLDKCKVLKHSKPNEDFLKDWTPKAGEWSYKDGCLIGKETGNKGGIMFSKDYFEGNVLLEFDVSTELPATRDVNAVFCAKWDDKIDYLGESYVCGLNGWWEDKAGIESNTPGGFCCLTNAYRYEPGKQIHFICGQIDGHCFMVIDGKLVMEYKDPTPIKGGYVGFSPYCTILKIKNIYIKEIYWEEFHQTYIPEF